MSWCCFLCLSDVRHVCLFWTLCPFVVFHVCQMCVMSVCLEFYVFSLYFMFVRYVSCLFVWNFMSFLCVSCLFVETCIVSCMSDFFHVCIQWFLIYMCHIKGILNVQCKDSNARFTTVLLMSNSYFIRQRLKGYRCESLITILSLSSLKITLTIPLKATNLYFLLLRFFEQFNHFTLWNVAGLNTLNLY